MGYRALRCLGGVLIMPNDGDKPHDDELSFTTQHGSSADIGAREKYLEYGHSAVPEELRRERRRCLIRHRRRDERFAIHIGT